MRSTSLLCALAGMFACASIAAGQSLLDRVEKSLKGAPPDAAAPGEVAPIGPANPADDPAAAGEESKSGYLGVGLEELAAGGIVVTEIAPGSPAEAAGLKVDDKITAVNRAAVKDIGELGDLMEGVPPGGKLTLTVDRGGRSMTLTATLSERPQEAAPPAEGAEPRVDLGAPEPAPADDLPPPVESATREPETEEPAGRASLGVTVVTFDDEARSRSEVPARNGALITQIRPLSPADRAGLPVGAVIVAYDGQPIDTADDLVAAIASSRPGDQVEITYYRGNSVSRKDVTLAAAADVRLLAPGTPLRDRPLLGRVERALDGLTRPGAGAGDPSAAPGAAPASSDMELREEVEKLKATIEALEMRLADVEAKLAAARPLPDADAAPAIEPPGEAAPADDGPAAGNEPAPTLRLPPRRPPTNVPKLKIGDE